MPGVRSTLKCAGLPCGLVALSVQIVAEKWSQNIFAGFAGRFVSTERDEPDAVSLAACPFSVEPRARHHEVPVLRIVFFSGAKDLPWSPRIFLIPESGNIQVRHRRGVKLADPCF